jgi:CRP/FNR family transcriptional regulator
MKVSDTLKIRSKCGDCENRTDNFFCNLSRENMQMFENLKISSFYPKGARLFVEGQPSYGVYMLCRGRVKLSTCSKDGKVMILHIAEAGEVLGLSSSFSDAIHIATAEALEPCQVNFIGNKDFLRFLEQDSKACLSIVKQLSENYQTACMKICSLGLSASVADKLATLFLGWGKARRENGDEIRLKMPHTHEDLAQMIGTSRETVTRIMKDFKNRRLISRKGAELIIPDKKRLEAVIGLRQRSRNMSLI